MAGGSLVNDELSHFVIKRLAQSGQTHIELVHINLDDRIKIRLTILICIIS